MCALCCAAPAAVASSNQVELKWSELAPLIIGHKVKLVLPGGPEIKGLAVAVREDALVLNVKKTSDRKAYPKGQNVIPRASLSTLQLETKQGSGGRTVGVIAGALGGPGHDIYLTMSPPRVREAPPRRAAPVDLSRCRPPLPRCRVAPSPGCPLVPDR